MGSRREVGQLYSVAKAILTPAFNFLWRIDVRGAEHIPASGPAIIAPNHISVLDSFMVPAALDRRITYVGKAEYLDSWKTKYLFPAMGMIAIDRTGGEAANAALDAAAEVLGRGELFGIYPEGTRSRDGLLHKGHTGVARLALRCGCPIVPVGIKGTNVIQPPDAKLPKVFEYARLSFGRPITVDRYLDRADDRLVLRQIADEVMYEIRELSGQEYVNSYASRKPESMPAEAAKIAVGAPVSGHGAGGNGAEPAAEPAAVAG